MRKRIFRQQYVFGKLNYNDDRHNDKVRKAVSKATHMKIGVNFQITTDVIEFVDKNDKIKFEEGKLSFVLSTSIPSNEEIKLKRKYDKFVQYVRELFHRVPTLVAELDEPITAPQFEGNAQS